MILELEPNEKYYIARCSKEKIDGMVFGLIEEELKMLFADGQHLILDISKTNEVTQEAVDAFIDRAEKQMEAQRTYVLINANDGVVKAFDDELPIVPTEHEAVDYFNFDELERQYDL